MPDRKPETAERAESGPGVPAVGTPIGGCIQIGHYGAHDARRDCLLIDAAGRCVNPAEDR